MVQIWNLGCLFVMQTVGDEAEFSRENTVSPMTAQNNKDAATDQQ
jgi:hypothetical protein